MSINVQVSPSPSVNISVGNATNHNNLLGLQGGENNQYYHLNSGQYINLNNTVYNFGNQNISGVKNFYVRPTVNGVSVLLSGESQQTSINRGPISFVEINGNDQTAQVGNPNFPFRTAQSGLVALFALGNIEKDKLLQIGAGQFSGINLNQLGNQDLLANRISIAGVNPYVSRLGGIMASGANISLRGSRSVNLQDINAYTITFVNCIVRDVNCQNIANIVQFTARYLYANTVRLQAHCVINGITADTIQLFYPNDEITNQIWYYES